MSVPPGRRRETGDDHGHAIRSEQREVPKGVVRLREKRNQRDKRQDPWRKANDQTRKGTVPTFCKRKGRINSQKLPIRVRKAAAGRQLVSGLRSLTRNVSGGDTAGRLRYGAVRTRRLSLQTSVASGN
jgi:hypothetical protein